MPTCRSISRAQFALGAPEAARALPLTEEATAFWSRFDPRHRSAGVARLWHARNLLAAGRAKDPTQALQQASSALAACPLPADRELVAGTQFEVDRRPVAQR